MSSMISDVGQFKRDSWVGESDTKIPLQRIVDEMEEEEEDVK